MTDALEKPTGELIKAGVELIKTAYDDALRPISKEAGKALGTLGGTVNIALAPLRGLVWSWEKVEEFLVQTVERKLHERKVASDQVVSPDPDIAVPAIQALVYSKLRDNYANLIATAMDKKSAADAHPAFVEILKQLTHDEVLILELLPDLGRHRPLINVGYRKPPDGTFIMRRHLGNLPTDAKCSSPECFPQFVDNLCRLGLTEIPPLKSLSDKNRYDRIRALAAYKKIESTVPEGASFVSELRMIGLTQLGMVFRKACVMPASSSP